MKTLLIAMLAALLELAVVGAAHAQPERYGPPTWPGQYDRYDWQSDDDWNDDRDAAVDVGFFYDELSPYGEWVRHPHYGWVWFPRHVRAGWRPYSLGYWVESDYGWTWISDEPFGWATYHYGRWAWDPRVGWLWVPGTDWGPAWVAWQHGNGYVGWAPLSPAVGFQIGVGIRLGGLDLSIGLAPRDYSFVEERRFLDRHVYGYIVPEARNVTIIQVTTNITRYSVARNRVINHGVPIERIERATGRRAPRLRVTRAPSPGAEGMQRDAIIIYRPEEGRLQSVRIARRNNAGLPPAPIPPLPEAQTTAARTPGARPAPWGDAPLTLPVAPRSKPLSRDEDERQFRHEQQDLRASQERERRALEQTHRREMAPASRAQGNAHVVAQRHAAELQAQQEQRQRSAQQLQNRQQLEREAAQATAATPHPKKGKKGGDRPPPSSP